MAESLKPWMCFHLMLADVGIFCLPLLLMASFQTGIIDATNTCVDCKTGSTLSAKVAQTWSRREGVLNFQDFMILLLGLKAEKKLEL